LSQSKRDSARRVVPSVSATLHVVVEVSIVSNFKESPCRVDFCS